MPSHLDENRLWPLAGAAQVAGLSPELLASAIANGDMPGVTMVALGPKGLRYVRAAPLLEFLEGPARVTPAQHEPEPDAGMADLGL